VYVTLLTAIPRTKVLYTQKKYTHKGRKDKNLIKPDLPTYSQCRYITTSYFIRYIEVKARAVCMHALAEDVK